MGEDLPIPDIGRGTLYLRPLNIRKTLLAAPEGNLGVDRLRSPQLRRQTWARGRPNATSPVSICHRPHRDDFSSDEGREDAEMEAKEMDELAASAKLMRWAWPVERYGIVVNTMEVVVVRSVARDERVEEEAGVERSGRRISGLPLGVR